MNSDSQSFMRPPAPRPTAALPKVRGSVRAKITTPYIILILVFTAILTFIISQFVLESITERFLNHLIEAAKVTSDWMVQEEQRRLETLRLVANTEGLAEPLTKGNAERLRELVLPLAINYQEEVIDLLDMQSRSRLSLRHVLNGRVEEYQVTSGAEVFSHWAGLAPLLAGQIDRGRDKHPFLFELPTGYHFLVAGPILNSEGSILGAVLVGKSLKTLVQQIRRDVLAHVTIYTLEGQPLVSTLLVEKDVPVLQAQQAQDILQRQNQQSLLREFNAGSIAYTELIGPWQARGDRTLGLLGVALPKDLLALPSPFVQWQIVALLFVIIATALLIGLVSANQVTRPLASIIEATRKVAQGQLNVRVSAKGDDELAVVAHAFNQMVNSLGEGFVYRQLLGQDVSPEVREALRQSFSSGRLSFAGQELEATILMSDIHDFTNLAGRHDSAMVLRWLNEYFGEIVPVITAHGGVVHDFVGDGMMAFFGILPHHLALKESATRACHAALEIKQTITQLNERRVARGEPALITGIGINSGYVTTGAIVSTARLHYALIGDIVNTTQRVEDFTHTLPEGGIVISQYTVTALADSAQQFELSSLGMHALKGKADKIQLYQLFAI